MLKPRLAATVLIITLLSGALLATACGARLPLPHAATPSPSPTPARPQSGIASGAAVPTGSVRAAPPARPTSPVPASSAGVPPGTDGTCPASQPIKIGRDSRAYAPENSAYAALAPISCYTSLSDAELNGYPAAGTSP